MDDPRLAKYRCTETDEEFPVVYSHEATVGSMAGRQHYALHGKCEGDVERIEKESNDDNAR